MRPSSLILSAFLPAVMLAVPSQAEIIDGVAAVVNGDIVMLSEVEEHAGPGLPPRDATGDAKTRRDAAMKRAADDLVTDKLFARECKDQNLEPTAAEIDAAIDDVQRSNHIDRPTLDKALKEQGLSLPRYRDMLSEQLCRMKVVEMKVKNRVSVTNDDVNNALANEGRVNAMVQEMKIRDIFVSNGASADIARETVSAAMERLRRGDDFATVAHDTPGPLATNGGDLGWMKESDLAQELQRSAANLKEGAFSEIIQTKTGFHILKVEKRRETTDTASVVTRKEEVRQRLFTEKMTKATEDFVQELRRAAEIDLRVQ